MDSSGLSRELEVVRNLCRAMLAMQAEATVVALAEQVVRRYPQLDTDDRDRWFGLLLDEFGPPCDELDRAVAAYQAHPDPTTMGELNRVAEPVRQELFRRINSAPGGTATVVQMRADLLEAVRRRPELKVVDRDLEHLLRSWFNRGFLTLERIDWNSPAGLLERLIRYEAVHEIHSWDDLRRRLAADRRCFGFFHPALPGEPLIFIEIALTRGLASSIQAVLAEPLPGCREHAEPDTAIFYSITNCQAGLAGVAFGDLLIKQVTAMIADELPHITRYSTLSPVPGFGRWLAAQPRDPVLAELDHDDWADDPSDALRERVVALCARYLTAVKAGRWPDDPVARFHLRNGARLERINWMGDSSRKGLAQSAGVLVNYLYDAAEIQANHTEFLSSGAVACSEEVRALAAFVA